MYLVSVRALANVFYSLLGSLDIVSVLVRDFDREFFFNGHDDFNGVQAVQTEVVDKVSVEGNLHSWVNKFYYHYICVSFSLVLDYLALVDLVETSQNVQDARFDISLRKTSAGRVETNQCGGCNDASDRSTNSSSARSSVEKNSRAQHCRVVG